jgi:hypothetical protein
MSALSVVFYGHLALVTLSVPLQCQTELLKINDLCSSVKLFNYKQKTICQVLFLNNADFLPLRLALPQQNC